MRTGWSSLARQLAAMAALALLAGTAQAGEGAKACCFNNPRYTGTCEVTPAEGETCAAILAYLNNPSAVGKQYCGNTNIRGGWQQVACQAASRADATTAAPTCADTPKAPQPASPAR
jgi:hypothetical protein